MKMKAYQDPKHSGNKIRPKIKCVGCGIKGCITAWGPWCYKCNIERMDRISKNLDDECKHYGIKD